MLQSNLALEFGSYIGLVSSIYWILLIYATGFLVIPLLRLPVLKFRNIKVSDRNKKRQERVNVLLEPTIELKQKIKYARQFASQKVITEKDITYSTEQDLLEQEIDRFPIG